MKFHFPGSVLSGLLTICEMILLSNVLSAQTFTVITDFDGFHGNGPARLSLVQGTDGNFYGTTFNGGTNIYGVVFRVTAQGTLTTVYNFCGVPGCLDGQYAHEVVYGRDGNFYGTTGAGGLSGEGTVYKVTYSGNLTTLYTFCLQAGCPDGSQPTGGLVEGTDGNFYGTTFGGGAVGCGTVFKITPTGVLTTLHSFGCTDGNSPYGELIEAPAGSLYGTTSGGGLYDHGTVFKVTRTGTFLTIHNFNQADGDSPEASLLLGLDENLYGTTAYGGANNGGTVFKTTFGGTFTTLHDFSGNDGQTPIGALIQATDGRLYGTTYNGGSYGFGTVFKIDQNGIFKTLHTFDSVDGANPFGGLIQGTNGILYGTTYFGGEPNYLGTIFSIALGLREFVSLQHYFGKPTQIVGIIGQGFLGTTAVSFNGIPSDFVVVSDTYLKATIPIGARTGLVSVTTPAGLLTSNKPFRVSH